MLKPVPVHDWTSHAADAFRYLAMTLDRSHRMVSGKKTLDYSRMGQIA